MPDTDTVIDQLPRRVRFRINGLPYTVGSNIPPWTRLIDYLRKWAHLEGTKVLCREGGCGLCTVVATVPNLHQDPPTTKTISVHACQTLVYSCAGWNIETIEYLGNRYKGYHSLQKALDGFYGTQCGYCSPGFIMTMYGQLKSSGRLSVSQVENSLDGNLCRCTGYRPILDAFKSLADDGCQSLKDKLTDIEDAYKAKCPKSGETCKGQCGGNKKEESELCNHKRASNQDHDVGVGEELQLSVEGVQWYKPNTITGVLNILKKLKPEDKVYVVVGNTGQGVYKNDGPFTAYIHTGGVRELYTIQHGPPLVLGANVSIGQCIKVFGEVANSVSGYHHLNAIADHWNRVANVSVRNVGSWAGNLMMKHKHQEFPSDLFLTLMVCEARLVLQSADTPENTMEVTIQQFLDTDMSRKIIHSIILPPLETNVKVRTFKISPRTVNAHAYVNACFKVKLDPADGFKVLEKPSFLFGGINPTFIHADQTETFLTGRRLTDEGTVVEAARTLGRELQPDAKPQDASPEYRKSLSQGLFFKTVIGLLESVVSNEVRSGGPSLQRPISSAHQEYDLNQDTWPVGKGVPKVESTVQISGEAEYLDDMADLPNEAHSAFVVSEYANAKIKSINATDALSVPGVLTVVMAGDVPGQNSFVVNAGPHPDPIFAEVRVKYAGQAVALVVADQQDTAVRAARLVKVEYEDIQTPILTFQDALPHPERVDTPISFLTGKKDEPHILGDPEVAVKEAKHTLKGTLLQGTQFHLTMEPASCRVVPVEDGYDVYATTQWPSESQAVVSKVLSVPAHRIKVMVRRIGGGYGGKISRQNVVVAATAVAARKLQRPVRTVLDLNTHMSLAGWREPYYSKYEVGFDDDGKVTGLKLEMMSDVGHVANEPSVSFQASAVQNCYYIPNFLFQPKFVNTDTAANTWCRTPGTVESVGTIENIMEHMASYLGRDPQDVRMVNMVPPGVPRLLIPPHTRNVVADDIIPLLMQKAMYTQRKEEVRLFNRENRWKKRGLSLLPIWYGFHYHSMFRYSVHVVVYEHDGTVVVSHGGIEMGQGINTKVAQVVAHTLQIPLDFVVVKGSDTFIGANSIVTGGSIGSDLCAHGAKKACEALRERMTPVKTRLEEKGEEPTWPELVKACLQADVDLSERYWTIHKEHPTGYDIWGACCLELELDVLTGQYLIRRVDLVEDCGRSLNPYVDIGQVEGSLIMGLGLYTSEMVKFDPTTGKKLSNGTWEYKPPTALDIPVDMRITLLPNAANPHGVLGSKATGEPALCLSYVVVMALRHAITAFRAENGDSSWFNMDTPLTVEKVHQLCEVSPSQFKLHTASTPSVDTVISPLD
ncbi:hypothetical protein Pmani_016533 [Petrolisthes manimaculis]|uniref:Aldehyde oxidase n=1 Tax=Petrolisthes manimaculis TaxID=1843537 RepID=A0AAE1UAE9_9EUCA|nr:hypothetical protein Pmani_016533 [Petrolisthes manimaculis]